MDSHKALFEFTPSISTELRQINPNHTDYHSDSKEISSTISLPHITDCSRKQEETHSIYANFWSVACDIFSIIPHAIGVEASFSLARDVIGWSQWKTTGETLVEGVVVRQCARANHRLLAGDDSVLDRDSSDNNMEVKGKADEKKLHTMAKVRYFFVMWQCNHPLSATQKESRGQSTQMTTLGYISDTEEIVKASLSNFHYHDPAAFKLSEKSPVPPALSPMDLPGRRSQVLNVRRIKRIDHHPAESDGHIPTQSIADKQNWRNWNVDSDSRNDS